MAASALLGLLTLVALVWFVYGPWQEICTDLARQQLFECRDAIFDLAADGKLSFQSREYREIRSSLEQSIRFAHELTLPRFIFLSIALRAHTRPSNLKQYISEIRDAETRKRVQSLVSMAQAALVVMMFAKSPVALALFPIPLLAFALGKVVGTLRLKLHSAAAAIGEIAQVEAERAPSAALKAA
jgi:hypothetical protein